MKKPESAPDESSNQDWIEKSLVQADAKLARLEAEKEQYRKLLGLVHDYKASAAPVPQWLRPKKKPDPGAATAVMQFSDWHLDERVDPAQVNGLNAYDREIALLRLKRWSNKACELGDLHRHKWDGALICANGDFVSGEIHDELRRTNAACLPETVVYWAPQIAAAYAQVADFYGSAHINVMRGNHGRRTHKPEAKNSPSDSWDWLLMQMVQTHLRDDKRITWDFATGLHDFVQIYDRYVHVSHGDSVKGGSGWAGIWTPLGTLRKKAMDMAAVQGLKISYIIAGHWHSTILAHEAGLSINGAGKGYDEYAMMKLFPHEQAKQNWFVEHCTRGVTIRTPIWLEDRRSEGW